MTSCLYDSGVTLLEHGALDGWIRRPMFFGLHGQAGVSVVADRIPPPAMGASWGAACRRVIQRRWRPGTDPPAPSGAKTVRIKIPGPRVPTGRDRRANRCGDAYPTGHERGRGASFRSLREQAGLSGKWRAVKVRLREHCAMDAIPMADERGSFASLRPAASPDPIPPVPLGRRGLGAVGWGGGPATARPAAIDGRSLGQVPRTKEMDR